MPANERSHVVAFHENSDNAALAQLNVVTEAMTNQQNNNLVVPSDFNLLGLVAGVGPSLTQIRLTSPSMQRLWPLDIWPFDRNATPRYPSRIVDRIGNPLRLAPNEQLQVQSAEDGTTTRQTVLLWLFPRMPVPITGEIFTMRATGTTTLTAFGWTLVPLTLAQNLPAGRYALVGLAAQSTGAIAARVAFVGGVYRPGVLGITGVGDDTYFLFRNGAMGVLGEFEHNLVPQIEYFSSSADTAEEVFLDLIKIG